MKTLLDIKASSTRPDSIRTINELDEWTSIKDVVFPSGDNNDSQSIIVHYENHKGEYVDIYSIQADKIDYVPIDHLINFNYALKQPIIVKIVETTNGEIIGDIEELELYSFGNDKFEVLRDLNKELTELFEDLISMADKKLGKDPKRWKNILNKYIRKS